MARFSISGTTGASENTIVFFPSGGHAHDGENSSLIDSTAYSIYDFSPSFVGTDINRDRAIRQENNRIALEDLIKRVVNNSVLAPAGIRLEQGSLNGTLIAANTITANQLAASTVTADELSANIVLINNVIRSSNFNGTIDTSGNISNAGSNGWAITHSGSSVFNNVTVRGTVVASNGTIGGWIVSSNTLAGGAITLNSAGSVVMNTTVSSNVYTTIINTDGFRNQWYDSTQNAYALYTIGPTAATHTGFWPGSNSLADSAIRERIFYFTNGIFMDSRAADGGTYSDGLVRLYVFRDGTNSYGVLDVLTKNNSGTQIQNVQIFNGAVSASGAGSFGSISASGAGSFGSVSSTGSGTFSSLTTSGGTITEPETNILRITADAGAWVEVRGTVIDCNGNLRPDTNGGHSLGDSARRWSEVFAQNATINISDERIKTEVENCDLGIDFINMLRPVSYKRLEENGSELNLIPRERFHYGLIAQEVKDVLDVSTDKDFAGWVRLIKEDEESLQALRYSEFIAPMIKAIQELSSKVDELEKILNKGVN